MRSSRFSPPGIRRRRTDGFPSTGRPAVTRQETGSPVSHTLILRMPRSADSLGVFLIDLFRPLASFAAPASPGSRLRSLAGDLSLNPGSRKGRSRQATLHPAQLVALSGRTGMQVLPQAVDRPCAQALGIGHRVHHEVGSPREQGQRPHAIADRPTPLTPSTNPQLGVESQHQGLHRCARSGFLAPPSGPEWPTRILRHPSITQCYYNTG
jgi:hypothetical protein